MVTKDDVLRILDLSNADFDSLQGIADLQRRVEEAHALFTGELIRQTTERFTGENADDPLTVIAEIDRIIDEKRDILKNAECDLKPIAWDKIEEATRLWLIPNWLPANTVTMFTGQGGAGKSWLTLQVACEIASHAAPGTWGKPNAEIQQPSEYDDSTENTPQHIVFATYEDEPAEIKRRLNALSSTFEWIASEREVIQQHLHIVDMRGVGSVWGPGAGQHIAITGELLRSGEALRAVCEDLKASLLILDPLSGAFGGNENDRTAVYDFVSSFRGWGDTAKCTMLAIGHLPKGAEGRAAGFSGSTAWEASARCMWKLSKEGDDKDEYWALSHTKSNYAPLQNPIPLIKDLSGWWKKAASIEDAIDGLQAYTNAFSQQERDNDEYTDISL